MKFKALSRSKDKSGPVVKEKTIDKSSKKKKTSLFKLEEKENRSLKKPSEASIRRPAEEVLAERFTQGLTLALGNEAKPIAKPVLSFVGPQNYFKRSFSMRAKSTTMTLALQQQQHHGSAEDVVVAPQLKTATIRRTFGKTLTRMYLELIAVVNCERI